jgi:hypothetical protein
MVKYFGPNHNSGKADKTVVYKWLIEESKPSLEVTTVYEALRRLRQGTRPNKVRVGCCFGTCAAISSNNTDVSLAQSGTIGLRNKSFDHWNPL